MKRQIIGLALGLALLGAGSAQALVIDNFSTPQGPIIIPVGPSVLSNAQGSSAGSIVEAGGTRTLAADTASGLGGILQILPGFKNLSANATTFTEASVTWQTAAGEAGDVDLTDGGASDFLIFGVDSLDHALVVTVTLFDGVNTATNTYYKHHQPVPPDPAGVDAVFCTNGVGDQCPGVIGPIFGNPSAGIFGNYYHALSLFNGGAPTIDPATGLAFGTSAPGPVNLTSIDRVVFSLTTSGDGLDFLVDCIYTGSRGSTGTESFNGQTYPQFDQALHPEDGARNACITQVTDIPEPASLLLMGTGLLGVGLFGLRKRSLRRRQQA